MRKSRFFFFIFFILGSSLTWAGTKEKLEELSFESRLLMFELYRLESKAVGLKSEFQDWHLDKKDEEVDYSSAITESALGAVGLTLGTRMAHNGMIRVADYLASEGAQKTKFLRILIPAILLQGVGGHFIHRGLDELEYWDYIVNFFESTNEWSLERWVAAEALTIGGVILIPQGSLIGKGETVFFGNGRSARSVSSTMFFLGAYSFSQASSLIANGQESWLDPHGFLADAGSPILRRTVERTAGLTGHRNRPRETAMIKEVVQDERFANLGWRAFEDVEKPDGEPLISDEILVDLQSFESEFIQSAEFIAGKIKDRAKKDKAKKDKTDPLKKAREIHETLAHLVVRASKRLELKPELAREIRKRVRESRSKIQRLFI